MNTTSTQALRFLRLGALCLALGLAACGGGSEGGTSSNWPSASSSNYYKGTSNNATVYLSLSPQGITLIEGTNGFTFTGHWQIASNGALTVSGTFQIGNMSGPPTSTPPLRTPANMTLQFNVDSSGNQSVNLKLTDLSGVDLILPLLLLPTGSFALPL